MIGESGNRVASVDHLDAAAVFCARSLGTFAPRPGVATTVTMPDGEDDNDALLALAARRPRCRGHLLNRRRVGKRRVRARRGLAATIVCIPVGNDQHLAGVSSDARVLKL